MKLPYIVVACLFVALANASEPDWENYKITLGQSFNSTEEGIRRTLFSRTAAMIQSHNSNGNSSFTLGFTFAAALTPAELAIRRGALPDLDSIAQAQKDAPEIPSLRQIPTTYDLRVDPCLPAIKDQGQCGSCWAFSAAVSLEYAECKKYGNTTLLSEQHSVDCDVGYYNYGCNGGFYDRAWNYLRDALGQARRTSYPYTSGATGLATTCKFRTCMIGARVSSWAFLPKSGTTVSTATMQSAIMTYGVLAVAIDAGAQDFGYYTGGVYNSALCTTNINHAVNLVGWGTLNGLDYWILRNSWGSWWGINGYMLIRRGVNQCAVETYPAYVVPV